MRFTYLGTSTAEGLPTIFCKCPVCERSRRLGGRNIRTRTQALIDERLLIDYPPETTVHMQKHGLCLADFSHVLITHSHEDHLYPTDIRILQHGFAYPPEDAHVTFHASEQVGKIITPIIDTYLAPDKTAAFHRVEPFSTFAAGEYTVTAFPASHSPATGPLFYQISDKRHTVLYAHDTSRFSESVWEYWKNHPTHLDFVSLDCTYALAKTQSNGHMNLEMNREIRKRMLDAGIATSKTIFACSHFSHNGGNAAYDDFAPVAQKGGFLTAFDGLTVEL